jgi:hypothetical protein
LARDIVYGSDDSQSEHRTNKQLMVRTWPLARRFVFPTSEFTIITTTLTVRTSGLKSNSMCRWARAPVAVFGRPSVTRREFDDCHCLSPAAIPSSFESMVMSLTGSLIPAMVGISRGAEMKREKTHGEHIYIKIVAEKNGIHLRKRICRTSAHHEIRSKQSGDRCQQDHAMTLWLLRG